MLEIIDIRSALRTADSNAADLFACELNVNSVFNSLQTCFHPLATGSFPSYSFAINLKFNAILDHFVGHVCHGCHVVPYVDKSMTWEL
jgi:hypothetical protein